MNDQEKNEEAIKRMEEFEAMMDKLRIFWAGCIAIHILFLLGVTVTGNWNNVFSPTPIIGVLIWIFSSDMAGLFAIAFISACFCRKSLIAKIICYPIGAVIMVMVFTMLAVPFLFVGVIIGGIVQLTAPSLIRREKIHTSY